ncbi:MAG: hypothetical protein CMN30_24720 [Sandaracinus sp.]|nr:hypothetical protein [Sandaracinus sp.]
MSWQPAPDPVCEDDAAARIALRVEARPRDLGGFSVRRVLPSARRRMVGPFIFFDHLGPATMEPTEGMEVRPHPHIHLATITYLFEGAIMHRDSLGSSLPIEPGAVNWMHAGRGIVHSERTPESAKGRTRRLHGIQAWVALPDEAQDTDPFFQHVPVGELPAGGTDEARWRLIAGQLGEHRSPVRIACELTYVIWELAPGARIRLPAAPERAVYVAEGEIECAGEDAAEGTLLVLEGDTLHVRATETTRLAFIGGAPVGPRFIDWNFVSSTKEAVEEAKRQWREDDTTRFPRVPGDEDERIPLPGT